MAFAQLYDSLREEGRNPLRDLHDALDEAVLAAYGFPGDEDRLAQLLALNQSIAEEAAEGTTAPIGPGNSGLDDTTRTQSRLEPTVSFI